MEERDEKGSSSIASSAERKSASDAKLKGSPRRYEIGDLVMVLDKTGQNSTLDPPEAATTCGS